MEYDIKRGHYANIEGEKMRELMEGIFGKVTEEGDSFKASYGALRRIQVKVLSKSSLWVETESEEYVPDEVALDTIRRYNEFMEMATGLTSKQRRDRLSKKAKEGKL